MATVVKLRPRVFTTAEAVIEDVRKEIFDDGDPYRKIAARCNVSATTIGNLASGKTRWPRPTTLFPLLNALGLEMRIVRKADK